MYFVTVCASLKSYLNYRYIKYMRHTHIHVCKHTHIHARARTHTRTHKTHIHTQSYKL